MNAKEFINKNTIVINFDNIDLTEKSAEEAEKEAAREKVVENFRKQYQLVMDAVLMAKGVFKDKNYGTFIAPDGAVLENLYREVKQLVFSAAKVDDAGNITIQFPLV